MLRRLFILGLIVFFVACAPKKTTVKTEGLEEVVVFGEEAKNISEEPVYPTPSPQPPTPESAPAPTIPKIPTPPKAVEEEITPLPVEQITVAPPIAVPPLPVEEPVTPPPAPAYTPQPATPATPSTPTSVYGFRVQIFASSTQKGASKVADDARGIFGGKVYIEHAPPYYKVRVGDCLTREEAEALKNLAISKGYRSAFIVETMVNP
ncbi:MAG: SPOR domain-containing protein [candidate division WOR-3 bacterium]|nr:SPOR domain-containing protein [candidate division WOR-3 bacterium]